MSAVVGPLRQIRFRDGSTQVYDPPRDTRDLRWIGCIDHHQRATAARPDDREPHRTARRARLAEMAEQAITAVLRIHSHCPGSRYCQGCHNVHPAPRASCSSPTHPRSDSEKHS